MIGRIGAIVLAAGASSRLGQPKQLLEFEGEPLLRRVMRAAAGAGCSPVVVVLGANADGIIREVPIAGVTVVRNEEWERGVGSSIRCGLRHLLDSSPKIDAVVLVTCDQPFVDAGVIATLRAQFETSGKPIVASRYAKTLGVPALFDRTCFDALLALPDNSGAKGIIEARVGEVMSIEFEAGAFDIDTSGDYERAKAQRSARR